MSPHLFVKLALVDGNFLVGLFKGFLKESDVLVVLFTLDYDLLDRAFLLPQDLDALGVAALLFIKFQLQVPHLEYEMGFQVVRIEYLYASFNATVRRTACVLIYPGFQFADDPLSSDDGVGLDFLQPDGQVLDFDFQALLNSLQLDDALLFLVDQLSRVFEVDLDFLVSLIRDL